MDFYATWCSHCKALAPRWETLAEVMDDAAASNIDGKRDDYSPEEFQAAQMVELPVVIAKIDCVTHTDVCNRGQNVRAYPTLRLFVDGEPWRGGDYRGHRTVIEMVEWLQSVEAMHQESLAEANGGDDEVIKLHTLHEGMLKP